MQRELGTLPALIIDPNTSKKTQDKSTFDEKTANFNFMV